MKIPQVGDFIYIPSSYYLSRGRDDFEGGLCKIVSVKDGVSAGKTVPFVEIRERPGARYNLHELLKKQDKLKERFGNNPGRKTQDYRKQFNEP